MLATTKTHSERDQKNIYSTIADVHNPIPCQATPLTGILDPARGRPRLELTVVYWYKSNSVSTTPSLPPTPNSLLSALVYGIVSTGDVLGSSLSASSAWIIYILIGSGHKGKSLVLLRFSCQDYAIYSFSL